MATLFPKSGLRLAATAWLALVAGLLRPCCNPPARAQPGPAGEYQVYTLQHKEAADVERMLVELLRDLEDETHVVADARRNQILLRGSEKCSRLRDSWWRRWIIRRGLPGPTRRFSRSIRAPPTAWRRLPSGFVRCSRRTEAFAWRRTPRHRSCWWWRPLQTTRRSAASSPQQPPAALPQQGLGNGRPLPPSRWQRLAPLEHRRAQEVESLFQELFGARFEPLGPPTASLAAYRFVDESGQTVNVSADRRRNAMLVWGEQPLADQVLRLIQAFDVPLRTSDQTIRVLPIRRADLAKVQEAVKAYRDGEAARAAMGALARRPAEARVPSRPAVLRLPLQTRMAGDAPAQTSRTRRR